MLRLLIIAGLGYFCYRKLKSLALGNNTSQKNEVEHDLLIQDPLCKTYFSSKDAFPLNINGKDYYFCSKECREKFIAMHSRK